MCGEFTAIGKYLESQGYRRTPSFANLVELAERAKQEGRRAKLYADGQPVAFRNGGGVITPDILAVHVRFNPLRWRWEANGRVIEKKGNQRLRKSGRYLHEANQRAMADHLAVHGIDYRGVWIVKADFSAIASNGRTTKTTRLRRE